MNREALLRWMLNTPVDISKLPSDAVMIETPTAVVTVEGQWAEHKAAEYDKVQQLNDEE